MSEEEPSEGEGRVRKPPVDPYGRHECDICESPCNYYWNYTGDYLCDASFHHGEVPMDLDDELLMCNFYCC